MSVRRQHSQGLQIPNGELPKKWETRSWLGAFLIREAILVWPDNLDESEETVYCNTVGYAVVSRARLQHNNLSTIQHRIIEKCLT